MKSKIKLLTILLCLNGALPSPALADQNVKDPDVEKLISKITARTSELENEVKLLKAELTQLKQRQPSKKVTEKKSPSIRLPKPESTFRYYKLSPCKKFYRTRPCPFRFKKYCVPVNEPMGQPSNISACFAYGSPVITSPYLGTRSEFDGSDLIVLNSGTNQDVHLLKEIKTLTLLNRKAHRPIPDTPTLVLSGRIEAQAIASALPLLRERP